MRVKLCNWKSLERRSGFGRWAVAAVVALAVAAVIADSNGFRLYSPAFRYGARIPKQYTGDGDDISPPLKWRNVPPGTRSLVLVCEDPDAPGRTWIHWVVYDIAPNLKELPAGVRPSREMPGKFKQGVNSWRRLGYGGPHPPPGKAHRYYFRLYAISQPVGLPGGARWNQVRAAMHGHVLAIAEYMGTYSRF